LNRISRSVISSSSTRVRNKIKWAKLKHSILDSTRLEYSCGHAYNYMSIWQVDFRIALGSKKKSLNFDIKNNIKKERKKRKEKKRKTEKKRTYFWVQEKDFISKAAAGLGPINHAWGIRKVGRYFLSFVPHTTLYAFKSPVPLLF